MEQVAHAQGHPLTEDLAALVLERRVWLEAGVVPPALEEASGVAEGRQAQRPYEAGHIGEVGVAPAAGRQRFDLDVAQEPLLHVQVGLGPRVEPDAQVVPPVAGRLDHAGEALHVGQRHLARVAVTVGGRSRVQAALRHAGQRPRRDARLIPAHVQEEAVHRGVAAQHLLDQLGQVVLVGAGHVQNLPAGVERLGRLRGRVGWQALHPPAVRIDGQPLRVLVGRVLVHLSRQVDRRADAAPVQRIDLRAGQVQVGRQGGVPARV